jgi:hypothetical protein
MKKILLIILTLFTALNFVKAQDTIYSNNYPKGILTTTLEKSKSQYSFSPINNATMKIKIDANSVDKIKYKNGEVFLNTEYKLADEDEIILLTDPLTGKVNYTGIIESKSASCKSLFNTFNAIPQTDIKYFLVASDETDFSYQKYVGRFLVHFAGDPYVMYFNLLVKFKDGKIKYEYSDFVATFDETKSKGELNGLFSSGVNTTTNEHQQIVDKLYSQSSKSDKKQFWRPTISHINESISSLNKMCTDISGSSKDW